MTKLQQAASAQSVKDEKSPKTHVLEALAEFVRALDECQKILPNEPEGQVRFCLQMMELGLQEVRHTVENNWVIQ